MYLVTKKLGTRQINLYDAIMTFLSDTKNVIITCLIVYAVFVSIYTFGVTKSNVALSSQLNSLEASYNSLDASYKELKVVSMNLQESYEDLAIKYDSLNTDFDKAKKTITNLTTSLEDISSENEIINTQNKMYYDMICDYSTRKELLDKYEYALFDRAGNRTDITYNQIRTAEEVCRENGVDIDFVLSTIMVESAGKEDAKNALSSATGYGQLIKGTARHVYENLMGNGKGTYNHSMALDGDTNIKMVAAYIGELQRTSDSMLEVINRYRGLEDTSYVNKINSYLIESGKSVCTLQINDGGYRNREMRRKIA